ncbi:unnamed protein product, partial [Ectocarpus fasciculatus]
GGDVPRSLSINSDGGGFGAGTRSLSVNSDAGATARSTGRDGSRDQARPGEDEPRPGSVGGEGSRGTQLVPLGPRQAGLEAADYPRQDHPDCSPVELRRRPRPHHRLDVPEVWFGRTGILDHQAGAVLRNRRDCHVGPIHDRVLAHEQAQEHVEGQPSEQAPARGPRVAAPGQRVPRGRAAVHHHRHHPPDLGHRGAQPVRLRPLPVRQDRPRNLQPAGSLPVDAVQDDRPGPRRHAQPVQAQGRG